jgi:hypothetical protein
LCQVIWIIWRLSELAIPKPQSRVCTQFFDRSMVLRVNDSIGWKEKRV